MTCLLGKGRLELCKDSIGGIQKVFFLNPGSEVIVESAADIITDLGVVTVYEYVTKDVSNLVQNVNSSRENGTTFWEQVLSLTIKKQDAITNKELKIMAYGNPFVFVLDNNSNLFMVGRLFGVDATGGTIVTGTAMGDLSGYTMVLTGREPKPANFLTPGVSTAAADYPFDGMTSAVTVTKGADPPA
jgi:hypothetical protein